MIGVAADRTDFDAVEEFFELFKTPWEPADPARRYPLAICTRGRRPQVDADVVVVYSSDREPVDVDGGVVIEHRDGAADVNWNGGVLPVYGGAARFVGAPGTPGTTTTLTIDGKAADYRRTTSNGTVWRIGYDLFGEVARLLRDGQPASRAMTPTLELHIELLRHVLRESGIAFVEIPPAPEGFDFACCLTHDVDFFGIRRHKLDRTLAGFVLRASLTSVVDCLRGRRTLAEVARNFAAVLSLPFVFAGWARDFWSPLDDYAAADGRRPSTFFLLPFKNRAGVSPDGTTDRTRAVAYDVTDVSDELRREASRGTELAVHGVDAWRDAGAGRAELARLNAITGDDRPGIRMHWLYFSADSPRELEAAGFSYDSTCGYNEAVGYRAGTSQAFRLPGSADLMELPLIVMDTAMFYPSRMGLAPAAAMERCRAIVSDARRFGGAIVINWHDRSLAPERLWDGFYTRLLERIEGSGTVWFATADQAVRWFRWRRSIRFVATDDGSQITLMGDPQPSGLPSAVIRVSRARGAETSVEKRSFVPGAQLTVAEHEYHGSPMGAHD